MEFGVGQVAETGAAPGGLAGAAIAGTRMPRQLSSTIRARVTRSRGALRARANRRTTASSPASRLAHARNTIRPAPAPEHPNHPATSIYTQ